MTAVAVTRVTDATTGQPGVRLNITGAASPPGTRYASDFTAGADGWAATLGTGTLTPDTTYAPPTALRLDADGDYLDVGRDVTGLTVGQRYRYAVEVRRYAGQVRIGVENVSKTAWTTTSSAEWTTLTYEWTATATTHKVKTYLQRAGGTWSTAPEYAIRNVLVTGPLGTWKGLRVTRTDANGTDVPVWNPAWDGDTYGGDLNLYDYEAALVGSVAYTVKDGADGTATGSVTLGTVADGTWIALPRTAWPYLPTYGGHGPDAIHVQLVTRWDKSRDSLGQMHQIIGRTDRVGNLAPLGTGSGSFEVLCLTYADAIALEALLARGVPAMIRQPVHAGLDLYFTVSGTSLRVDPDTQLVFLTVNYDRVIL